MQDYLVALDGIMEADPDFTVGFSGLLTKMRFTSDTLCWPSVRSLSLKLTVVSGLDGIAEGTLHAHTQPTCLTARPLLTGLQTAHMQVATTVEMTVRASLVEVYKVCKHKLLACFPAAKCCVLS